MHGKPKDLLAAALLGALLAAPAPTQAAVPGPVTGESLSSMRPADTTPPCGSEGARLRLSSDWTQGPGEQLCILSLERLDGQGRVASSVLLQEASCGPNYLVCDRSGGGVVAMADHYEVTSWNLQAFAPDGSLLGSPRPITPDPRCNISAFWSLSERGDLVLLDTCWSGTGQSVVLRRFPADADTEPEPVWIRGETTDWINVITAATDGLGNMLVAWDEYYNQDEHGQSDSRVMARGVGPDGVPRGRPFQVDAVLPHGTGLVGVVIESDGIFSVYMRNGFAGGTLVRTVSIDPDVFTVTTTTTTTLPRSPDAPVFGLIRTVGQVPPAPDDWTMTEGSLASMKGDGNGTLMLRRWTLHNPGGNPYFYDPDLPQSSAHLSENAGVRWSRAEDVPPVTDYQDTPPWDAASPNGTLLAADFAGREVRYEDWTEWVLGLQTRRSTDGGRTWSDTAEVGGPLCWDCDEFFLHDVAMTSDGHGTWMAASVSSRETNGGAPETWRTNIDVSWSFDDGRTWTGGTPVWELVSEIDCCDESSQMRQLLTAVAGSDGSWGLAWRSETNGAVRVAHTAGAMSAWEVDEVRPPFGRPSNIDPGDWWDPAKPYSRPAMVATPVGTWVLAWEEKHAPQAFGADGDIFFVRSSDDGGSWSDPAALNAYAAIDGARDMDPSLAADGAGGVLAVWSSHDPLSNTVGVDSDIVSSISLDGGVSWSPPAVVDPAAATDERQDLTPLVVASGNGGWTVAWTTQPFGWRRRWEAADTVVKVAVAGSTCGNGAVDAGEECDDANDVNGDGCNTNCTLPGCRNEVADEGEVCEYDDPTSGAPCTTTCELPVCGDGERDIWTEQCDDGNADDGDLCPTTCRQAHCGDGFVFEPSEECDDANTANDDTCNNGCDAAYCGDGTLRPGVEECDDGDGWGGNSCTDECRPAVCGDGRVWLGVEQCDDPDGSVHHGNCTADCRFVEPCTDADASGRTTASDALTILRNAVDLGDVCTPERCDVNGSGTITAVDASGALRSAVGLDVALNCPMAGLASFALDASPMLGALQISVTPGSSNLAFGLGYGETHCELKVPNAMLAVGRGAPGQALIMGLISLTGFQGPIELARCPIYARRDQPAGTGSVEIRIDDATAIDGSPVYSQLRVRMVTR